MPDRAVGHGIAWTGDQDPWHNGIDGLGKDVVPTVLGEIEMPRPVKLYNHSQAPQSAPCSHLRGGKGHRASARRGRYFGRPKPHARIPRKELVGGVPVLELDDGSYLSESVAICRFLEGLHPEPNLLGRDLREQAEIERWNRRMELELFAAIGRTVQNTSPIFQGRFKQFPDYGEAQRTVVYQRLERMDRELNGHQFVAGDRFTIADITALVAIDIGRRLADIKIAPELAHLTRWHQIVSSRPSAKA
jgi:glutathione S-transferase